MIDKHTGREIVSPADKLADQNNLMQKILSLKLTASQTSAIVVALGLGESEIANSLLGKDQIPRHRQD